MGESDQLVLRLAPARDTAEAAQRDGVTGRGKRSRKPAQRAKRGKPGRGRRGAAPAAPFGRRARQAAARHLGLRVLREEPPPARLRQPAQGAAHHRQGGASTTRSTPARRRASCPTSASRSRQLDETRFRVAVEDNGPGIVRAAGPEGLRQAALRLEVPPPAAEPRPAGHRHLRGRHVRPAHDRQADRHHDAHRREEPPRTTSSS